MVKRSRTSNAKTKAVIGVVKQDETETAAASLFMKSTDRNYSAIELSVFQRMQETDVLREREKAAARREDEHWELRKRFTWNILRIFIWANAVVLFCIGAAVAIDLWNAKLSSDYFAHRIFDKQVLMALIGSITFQLGAIAFAISKWLFK